MPELPPESPPVPSPPRPARWRRLVGLGALGAAAALVVATLVGAMRHDVRLVLDLDPAWQAGLERLLLEVLPEGDTGPALAGVELRWGPGGPGPGRPEHVFQLRNGRYELHFVFHRRGELVPVRVRRSLEVAGAARVSLALP